MDPFNWLHRFPSSSIRNFQSPHISNLFSLHKRICRTVGNSYMRPGMRLSLNPSCHYKRAVQIKSRWSPFSFPTAFMPTTLCTCGCGQQVSYTTKQHHLNGYGKMTLRARIAAENEWLKSSTSQQPQISRKRSYSTSDQNSSCTRRKAAQVEIEEEPEVFPADADPMEPLFEPPGHVPKTFPTDADPVEPLLEPPGHIPEIFPADCRSSGTAPGTTWPCTRNISHRCRPSGTAP